MPYFVDPIEALVNPNTADPREFCDELAASLNKYDEDGYRLVHIIDQHKQWPDSATQTEGMLAGANMGVLTGPLFVWHKEADTSTEVHVFR